MDWSTVVIVVVTAAFNGAVTLAVLRVELRHVREGVQEAKDDAAEAHRRIDDLLLSRAD